MSTSKITQPARSATIDDCVRLWSTLTADFIPGLRLELELINGVTAHNGIRVRVCDYSTIANMPMGPRSVWAERDFYNPLHLISISQLFDLLISAYRVMDEYFATGVDNRPTR